MSFSLGSIDPLNVAAWAGFDYPERAQILALLGNGTSALNAVVQESAHTFREAQISGTIEDSSDLDTLRGYAEDRSTSITFTDDGATAYTVVVIDLAVSRIFPSVWTYACRLVEVG